MENFTNTKLSGKHFVYYRHNGIGRQALRLYAELYLGRRVTHHIFLARLHQCLRENGIIKKQTPDCGSAREVRTVPLEDAVLDGVT